jgi:hypothetical protein
MFNRVFHVFFNRYFFKIKRFWCNKNGVGSKKTDNFKGKSQFYQNLTLIIFLVKAYRYLACQHDARSHAVLSN